MNAQLCTSPGCKGGRAVYRVTFSLETEIGGSLVCRRHLAAMVDSWLAYPPPGTGQGVAVWPLAAQVTVGPE